MRELMLFPLLAVAVPAAAQTPTITLYELPAYLGRAVTVTADTPDLANQTFSKRAQSARVTGSWQVCPTVSYAGTCRTVAADTPYLQKSQIVSLRPTQNAAGTASAPAGSTNAASSSATVDIDSLDAGTGTDGQDVSFFAKPSLGGSEISAGTNDITSATAFCKAAGASSASYAGRARVQASNLIDISGKSRARGFALRDVVCKRQHLILLRPP